MSQNAEAVPVRQASETPPDATVEALSTLLAGTSLETSDDEQRPLYTHDPLPKGCIRLLRMTLDDSDAITCQLKAFDLNSLPLYYALSYVWGSETSRFEISVNNSRFLVSPNLLLASRDIKRYFRVPADSNHEHWLWTDAICIQQEDLEEKSSQIPMMHVIYGQAETVLISLGQLPETMQIAKRVLNWLERWQWLHSLPIESNQLATIQLELGELIMSMVRLAKRFEDEFEGDQRKGLSPTLLPSRVEELESEDGFIPRRHHFWDALFSLTGLEWFYRVWTIQEVVLAKQAIVICAGYPLRWNTILAAVSFRCNSEMAKYLCARELQLASSTLLTLAEMFSLELFSKQYLLHSKSKTLYYWLMVAWGRRATNARDYVYAILGLVEEQCRVAIAVDYAKPNAQVFVDAMRYLISTRTPMHNPLIAFWAATSRAERVTPNLASWCPNIAAFRGIHDSTETVRLHEDVCTKYEAFTIVRCLQSPDAIQLQALHLDDIQQCSQKKCPGIRHAASGCGVGQDQRVFDAVFSQETVAWVSDLAKNSALFTTRDGQFVARRENMGILYDWCLEFTGSKCSLEEFSQLLRCAMSFYSKVRQHELFTLESVEHHFASRQVFLSSEDVTTAIRMLPLLVTLQGMYIFETVSGRVGLSSRPLSQAESIYLVPGSDALHAMSTETHQYGGCVYVQGLSGDTLLSIPEDLKPRWEDVTLE